MKKILFAAFMLLAPLAVSAQKFGHFNSTDIIPAMPEYIAAQNEIQTLAKQFEDELTRLQTELKSKNDEYEKVKATLLDNVRQSREQELQDLYNRMQQNYQDNQQALNKAQTEKMQAISEKITAAVKTVGDAGGYIYIMDTSAGIPYISTKLSTDITVELKKALGI